MEYISVSTNYRFFKYKDTFKGIIQALAIEITYFHTAISPASYYLLHGYHVYYQIVQYEAPRSTQNLVMERNIRFQSN